GKTEGRVDSGKYYTTRVKPGKDITIEAGADKYLPKIMLKNISSTDTIITVMLNPRSRKCIEGKIFDKDDNKALAGVKVAIYDEDGNKYLDQVTDSSGTYSICNLPLDKALYIGSQKKPEYFSNTDKFFIRKDSDLVKNIYALKIVVGKAIKVDNIYFDKGKYNVRPDAALELDKLVRLMKDNPEVIIELSSHTDCNGPAASNLTLSDKRAKSAAAYIISKSIDSKRIKGKGYGESKLVNDCKCEGKKPSPCSEEQHAQNRRVEIKVTGFVVEKPAVTPAKVTKKKK
ncbi:MAG: OmpA family protein, partial [Bacteroidia bacterium]